MAAAMVTMQELRTNLGIGTLYTDATVEECCQSAEDLIQGYLWHNEQAYTATPAIREAAMIVAVDIWQSRQVSQTGGVGMDGVSASPYRMGYQLINRVRGLIQPYSSPNSLVG